MSTAQLISQIDALPEALKAEVEDFVAFLAQKQEKEQPIKKRKIGLGKGSFEMMPDFDEPLEEFKDYM
jgi:hypothetical protein